MALEVRDDDIPGKSELTEIGDVVACVEIFGEDHVKLGVSCTILVPIPEVEKDSLVGVLVSVFDVLDITVLDKAVSVKTVVVLTEDMSLAFPAVCGE